MHSKSEKPKKEAKQENRRFLGGQAQSMHRISEQAIRRVVAAHIRHRHTIYDELLDDYADR